MADQRFFQASAPASLSALAELTGAVPHLRDGQSLEALQHFTDVAPLETAGASDVSFLDNAKYAAAFAASNAGACFVRSKYIASAPAHMLLLVTEEPYYAYALAATHFYPAATFEPGIAASAVIAESASIGRGVRIDAGAVIGERVTIADGCHIGANTVISAGVEVGAGSSIGALCSISHTLIGKRVIIHRGVHIGQDGFGFAPGRGGILKVPQLGRVVIGDMVEIGSGTCIDRGAGPDTIIGMGTKIDNLVQIAHNVQIGRFCFVVSQVGIAGSTQVGDGVMLGGQVGLAGHITIGAGAKVAAKSGVMTDLEPRASYGGIPAMPIKDWHRQTVSLAKLAKGKKKESTDE